MISLTQLKLVVNNFSLYAIFLSLVFGQIIKMPLGLGGVTLLDLTLSAYTVFSAFYYKSLIKNIPIFIKVGFAFLGVATISLIFTPLNLSFQETLNSFLYIFRIFVIFYFGWFVYSYKNTIFEKTHIFLLMSGITIALLGLVQLVLFPDLGFLESRGWDPHFFRLASSFIDPNFTGGFLVLTIVLLMGLWNMLKFRKNYKIAVFILLYLALTLTFSRSSYLMFLFSTTTFSAFLKSMRLAVLSITLFVLLFVSFWGYTQLVSKPRGIDRSASASFRLTTWQQGYTIWQKSPILGVGFNAYKYALRDYKIADKQFLNSRGSTSNDFSLLHILATTGLVGLIFYLLLLSSLIYTGWKIFNISKDVTGVVLISGLVGLLAHSIFNNSLFYPFILIWIMLIPTKYPFLTNQKK
ncbi:O-antigen ligase family protein [Candidatus Daviesbacteria bacterium]|nr:O-antigen ligase family protein [Candidatus Daviesbacteria bacterium]